jgi:hypothetical protein
MDPQSQALLQVLQESLGVIQQARAEQGWTAGAVALVLGLAIAGLGWMVRRLVLDVRELNGWRANVLQGQIETTTRALDASSSGMAKVGTELQENTTALRETTGAVHSLRDAIRLAPCGRQQMQPAG